MKIKNKAIAALVFGVFAFTLITPSAGAATVAELQAQIQALLQQIQDLQRRLDNMGSVPPDYAQLVDLVTTVQYSNGNQSAWITATIKGNPENRRISYWQIDLSCAEGVVIPGKGGSNDLCGSQWTINAADVFDVTQDYLVSTIGANNEGGSDNPNVGLALRAYAADGAFIGGDKEGIWLGFPETRSSMTLLAPNGGEIWQNQGYHKISWTPDNGGPAQAYLEKLENGRFVTKGKIIEAARGSILWDGEIGQRGVYAVPGDGYYVRVVDQNGREDRSDRPFRIAAAGTFTVDVKVNGSNGPLTVKEGDTLTIRWSPQQAATGSCDVSWPGGGENGKALSGYKQVVVPRQIFPYYPVRQQVSVWCKTDLGILFDYVDLQIAQGTSSATSTIVNLDASATETGLVNLSWQASAPTDARIRVNCQNASAGASFYVSGAGKTVSCNNGTLATYYSKSGSTVSAQAQSNFQSMFANFTLELLKNGVPTGEEETASLFIRATEETPASVTVLTPNGGETWPKGSSQTIRWSSSGVPAGSPVDVILKKEDFSELDLIFVQRGANDGSENVIVPAVSTGQYRIYVRATNGTAVWDDRSNATFNIVSAPTPANQTPGGYHDALSCTVVQGWACDPDSYSSPLNVVFYKDAAIGQGGQFVGSVTANQLREAAVGQACGGGTSAHGFSYATPYQIKDGQTHSLYAYAVDAQTGNTTLLGASPKSVSCGTATPETEAL